MKRLKVAFLLDGPSINPHIYSLIEALGKDQNFKKPVAIYCSKNIKPNSEGIKKLRLVFKKIKCLISFSFRKVIKKVDAAIFPNQALTDNDLSLHLLDELEEMRIDVQEPKANSSFRLTKILIQELKSKQIDIIVQRENFFLTDDLFKVSRLGILSLHFSGISSYNFNAGGLWEVLHNIPSTQFAIEHKMPFKNSTLVLGSIMTTHSWCANNSNLIAKLAFFLKNIFDQAVIDDYLIATPSNSKKYNQLPKKYHISTYLKYALNTIRIGLSNKILSAIYGSNVSRWSIAYAKHKNFSKSLSEYIEIKNPDQRFLADPFLFQSNGQTIIFAEDYFYDDGKGRISAINISNSEPEFLGVVLEEDFHLSFPFIFENDGTIYMIPETHQADEIRLYECSSFPMEWTFKMTLLKNVSSADTMIFKHANSWFLFTNICSAKINEHQSELHIFWSDTLLSDDWKPLEIGNPVIFDSQKARNGGFLISNNQLYRINQLHGRNHYGKGFGVNLVKTLSKNSFEEIRVKDISPIFKDNIVSTHHFNAVGDIAVTDYCRTVSLKNIK